MQPEKVQITVRPGEPLRRTLGAYRLQVTLPAPATLASLLDHLARTYPDFGPGFRGDDLGHDHPYRLFVNQRQPPAAAGLDYELQDGDLVHIVLPVAGGGGGRMAGMKGFGGLAHIVVPAAGAGR